MPDELLAPDQSRDVILDRVPADPGGLGGFGDGEAAGDCDRLQEGEGELDRQSRGICMFLPSVPV